MIEVIIDTETDISTHGIVTIDYHGNNNKKRMYKIGNNGVWVDYNGEFEIDSYEIIEKNWHNEETKDLKIYLKMEDDAKNIVQIEKNITNIDVDIAKAPVIKYTGPSGRMPVLNTQGVFLDENVNVSIEFDEREDIINYYSVDNGVTWNIYTGIVNTNSPFLVAKSIKKDSGLEINKKENCSQILNDNAMGVETYDKNSNTYTTQNGCYMYIDEDARGGELYVEIAISYSGYIDTNPSQIIFYDINGVEIEGATKVIPGLSSYFGNVSIPQNAVKFTVYNAGYFSYSLIYELDFYNSPVSNDNVL